MESFKKSRFSLFSQPSSNCSNLYGFLKILRIMPIKEKLSQNILGQFYTPPVFHVLDKWTKTISIHNIKYYF